MQIKFTVFDHLFVFINVDSRECWSKWLIKICYCACCTCTTHFLCISIANIARSIIQMKTSTFQTSRQCLFRYRFKTDVMKIYTGILCMIIYFNTYFPWYQYDNTHVIFFWDHILYSYDTPSEEQSQQKQVWGGKYVIKRISDGLWYDIIFIQRVVRFLSPSHGL
jgi:hypothetical protein